MSRTNDAQAEADQTRVGGHPEEFLVDGEVVGGAGKISFPEWPERRCAQPREPYTAIAGHPKARTVGHKPAESTKQTGEVRAQCPLPGFGVSPQQVVSRKCDQSVSEWGQVHDAGLETGRGHPDRPDHIGLIRQGK